MRTRLIATLGALVCAMTAHARLDYIDADGVTETGGTPDKARMLTRTKSDGKLDASLLPPLGALASIPDPKRIYVSATAPANGNGSALAPFQTLQEAVTNVAAGGAIILAPGAYSASWSLPAASSVTLVGCGPSTVLTLAGTVVGSSPDTELRIVSAAVSSLYLSGGQAKVRLLGAQVSRLEGTASPLTVVRTDLGAKVETLNVSGATNTYEGHDTVPYATRLGDRDAYLALDGTRPVLGDESVAFLSDVASATNGVYGTLDAFRAADAALATSITATSNEAVRLNAALAASVGSATNDLRGEISGVSSWWGGQISTLNGSIGGVSRELASHAAYTTNQVSQLTLADAAIRTDFAAADNTLSNKLNSTFSQRLQALENSIPATATAQATAVLNANLAQILEDAADRADTKYIQTLRQQVTALAQQLTALSYQIATNRQSISTTRAFIKQKHTDAPW